ncbi:MAG: flippase-like domain-containing protein [Cytophagales bacterium]|nr:flippase-like domain-containing protein [Cytophagales bacterium]
MKNKWTIIGSSLISFFLIVLISKKLDFLEVQRMFDQAKKLFLFLAGILLLLSHYIRALRWNLLIKQKHIHVTAFSCFLSFLSGTLVNFILPHAGDLARCKFLEKQYKTDISFVFGTVLIERLLDGIILLVLVGWFIIFNQEVSLSIILHFLQDINFMNIHLPLYLIALISLVLLLLGVFFFKYTRSFLIIEFFKKFISGILHGFNSIGLLKARKEFLFYSMIIWILYFVTTFCILASISNEGEINKMPVLGILIMASLGWAGPTQGGIGLFHFLVSRLMILFGFSKLFSISASTLLHTTYSIYDLVFGLGALITINLLKPHFTEAI